jgi:hypothetical protein
MTIRKTSAWQTDAELEQYATMLAYKTKSAEWPESGWYWRQYHSPFAMRQHLKGVKGWEMSFADTGPFRTQAEARKDAIG